MIEGTDTKQSRRSHPGIIRALVPIPQSHQSNPVNRPRARVTVAPRSFLDAGTEVLPGERKFTENPDAPAVTREAEEDWR